MCGIKYMAYLIFELLHRIKKFKFNKSDRYGQNNLYLNSYIGMFCLKTYYNLFIDNIYCLISKIYLISIDIYFVFFNIDFSECAVFKITPIFSCHKQLFFSL